MNKTDIQLIDNIPEVFIQKALDYALISWTSTFNRMQKPNPFQRIKNIANGLICEQALEKFLNDKKINFDLAGKTKWYEVDRYDIGIGPFAIDLKSNQLDLNSAFIRRKYSQIQDKNEWFLDCSALVPLDQFNPGQSERRTYKRDKIYIFAFMEFANHNLFKNSHLVHAFWDYEWLKKAQCKGGIHHGKLEISYKGKSKKNKLTIYGTSNEKEILIETVNLDSKKKVTESSFYQVFSCKFDGEIDDADISVTSIDTGLVEIIQPDTKFDLEKTDYGYEPINNNWANFELSECKIYLLGWIYEEDFRVVGKKSPRFDKTIEQYQETKVDNWAWFVNELKKMSDLKKIK